MSRIWMPDRQIIAPSRRVWTPPSRQRGFVFLPGGGLGASKPAGGGGGSGLQYVGGTGATAVAGPYNVSLNGTLTGGIATSPSPGDLVLVFVSQIYSNTSANPSIASSDGSGSYTAAHDLLVANSGYDTFGRTYYKVQGASVDTTLSISSSLNSSYPGATVVHVWRGANASTPMDVTPTTATAAGDGIGRPNPPSITPLTTGAVIVAFGVGVQDAGSAAYTIPSGMGNGVSLYRNTVEADIGSFGCSVAWTSGAYDPAAATGGVVPSFGTASWAAVTLALRPA